MVRGRKRVPAAFYQSDMGAEPVRAWLKALPKEDRAIIGVDIKTLEFGWPIGMPLCKPLGDGLWEIRSNLTHARIARVIFCMRHSRLVLLHSFIKKQQKTPKTDLDIARKRQREIDE